MIQKNTIQAALAVMVSAPFEFGDKGMMVVKVIDDRGNELIVTKRMEEVE